MSYGPWRWRDADPSPEQRRRAGHRARVFTATLSALVQIPGVVFACWHLGHLARLGSLGGQQPSDVAVLAFTLLGLAASACILLPWRGPAVVTVTALALGSVALSLGPPAVVLAVAFAVARAVAGRAGVWAWSALAGMGVVGAILLLAPVSGGIAARVLIATILLCIVAGISTGAAARRERFRAAAREATTRRRSAAEEERLRIARELHDVLAHSLSQISVQAGVGLHLFDEEPERARDSLRSIRDTSATALEEVRSVLGVLRSTAGDSAPRTPGPSLAGIRALVAEAVAAGQRVTLIGDLPTAAEGTGRVPGPVQSACYRIVQESVTNTRRHAPGAAVRVSVQVAADNVQVEVENGPPPPAAAVPGISASSTTAPGAPTPGRGIIGIGERAAALGGRADAHATPGGGFRVSAVLPYRAIVTPSIREEP